MSEFPDRDFPASHSPAWRDWLLAFLVSALTALSIVAIFAVRGIPSGHDFEFHAAAWLEVAGQWRQGIVYPRWADWANWGFGEPRFVFYPPLSWMLGAALGIVVGWKLVAGAFVVLTQTLAGISMFALARRMLPRRSALFAAFCYAGNPYALLVVFMRSDFAEQLASAFLPLFLLALEDLLSSETRKKVLHSLVFFAAGLAVIWLCNAPAGVLASYSAALLFAWHAIRAGSWKPLGRGAAGLALGFGLSAFYLIPAAYEQRWVHIGEALASGLRPVDNFLYTMVNDPEHNLFNWIASTTAVTMIVLTGAAGVATYRRAARSDQKESWQRMMLLAAAASVLMLSISAPLWKLLPKLAFLQFPWRWMIVLAVPLALFLGAALRGRLGWIWVVVIVAAMGTGGTVFVQQTWWDTEDIPVLQEAIASGTGYEGVDEYDLAGDDHSELPREAPRARVVSGRGETPKNVRLHVEHWGPEEKILRVSAREPVRVELRLLHYPAWRFTVNGKQTTPETAEGTARVVIHLPAGESEISARFRRTGDRWMGAIASGLSAILCVVLLAGARRE